MKNAIIIGGLGAFATGLAISLQSMISGRAGDFVGPIKTGLWTNFLGGALAALIILGFHFLDEDPNNTLTMNILTLISISGALGILIIMGISFSVSLAGVTAGSAAVFLGQTVLSIFADTLGWGGAEQIPLDPRRILGLIIMSVSVWLLLPKK